MVEETRVAVMTFPADAQNPQMRWTDVEIMHILTKDEKQAFAK